MLADSPYQSSRAVIMGLGRFGGGLGAARFLAQQGADVLVTDLASESDLARSIAELQPLIDAGAVNLRLGEHNVSDFTTADLVVVSPAVAKPWDNRFVRAAQAAGVRVTTEIRLLLEILPESCAVVGVTGTAGKSTTTAMIHHIVQHAQIAPQPDRRAPNVHLGGNIGGSLLAELDAIKPDDIVVLELSSAQLYWLFPPKVDAHIETHNVSFNVAVITNIAPNHLDWHGSLEHYRQSKLNLIRHRPPGSTRIVHESLRRFIDELPSLDSRTVFVSDDTAHDLPPLQVVGGHNRVNAALAVAAAGALGIDVVGAHDAVATFPGLPHRLESLGTFRLSRTGTSDGTIRAFNDSKCTTPEACALALKAIGEDSDSPRGIVLIAGGYDKKIDLSPLAQAAAAGCAKVFTIGATGPAIAQQVIAHGGTARFFENLASAVDAAVAAAEPGQAFLLSPGCASWDQFKSYEERGHSFAALLRAALGPPIGTGAPASIKTQMPPAESPTSGA